MSSDRHLPSTASEYFGEMAASYDSLIRRAVPRYDEMQARLIDYMPGRALSIVELGCGTGNLTLAVALRYPEGRLTVADASPEMIEIARTRLEADQPKKASRARFLVSRFEDLELEEGAYDLAASSISLHHVRDKERLFRRIHAGLRPGGSLLFADQFRGATPEAHDLNWERWLAFCREPGHCTAEEIQSLIDHATAHDHYESLADHFRMLEAAGFRSVDCAWRNWMWGIVVAERA